MNAAVLLEIAVVFFFGFIAFMPGLSRKCPAKTIRVGLWDAVNLLPESCIAIVKKMNKPSGKPVV